MKPQPRIEVWHSDDHRLYEYRWDATIERYVQQPGPGRPAVYRSPRPDSVETAWRQATQALKEKLS